MKYFSLLVSNYGEKTLSYLSRFVLFCYNFLTKCLWTFYVFQSYNILHMNNLHMKCIISEKCKRSLGYC